MAISQLITVNFAVKGFVYLFSWQLGNGYIRVKDLVYQLYHSSHAHSGTVQDVFQLCFVYSKYSDKFQPWWASFSTHAAILAASQPSEVIFLHKTSIFS